MLDLDELLRQESDRIEWKSSVSDDALEAVCALANDIGDTGKTGYVLLGVDKTGRVVGADASDSAQLQLSNRLKSTKILPNPSVDLQAFERDGKSILVISVQPYSVPPIVRVNQTAFVRVGTSTHRASEADLSRLQERRPENRLPADLRVVPSATLDDLDLGHLHREFDAANSLDHAPDSFPEFGAWLGQRDIARRAGNEWRATLAGLLMFGLSPQSHVPGATIEFARYSGADFDSQVLHRRTLAGSIPDQLDGLWTQLSNHLSETLTENAGMRTLYRPEYPLEALRELARNMVQHRIYEGTNAPGRVSWLANRIVFTNPGSRFGRSSEGEFGSHSDYRNPTITRLLVDQGYVEKLGRGIRLVRAQLEKNGNPPLEVESDGFTSVTLWRRP